MRVVKRNKRLWIDDDDGKPVYTPPNFIRVYSRQALVDLAAAMECLPPMAAIMEFEASAPRGSHRLGWTPSAQ